MPDKTSSSEQPLIGMITDSAALSSKKGSWTFALNTNVESLDGNGLPIPQNEHSNFLNTTFPPGFIAICNKYIKEKDRIIYFLVNPSTGVSQIGEVPVSKCFIADTRDMDIKTDCVDCGGHEYIEPPGVEEQQLRQCATYYPFVESACLGFNYNYPIDIEYRLTNRDLRLYFTDGLSQRRFLYLDFEESGRLKVQKEFNQVLFFDSGCNAPVYGLEIDCNKMLVQPSIRRGCLAIADVLSGGQCQSGTYQFFICYADVNGNQLSEYFPGTNPVPIHNRDVTIQDDQITDKGILISTIGLDYSSYYRYYNVAVSKVVNGGRAFYKVATLPIGVRNFFYTDNFVSYLPLSENDILKVPAYYKTASFVTASNGILYWGGMKEFPKGNWQRVANIIKVGWQTAQIPLGSYAKPEVAEKYRGLMRDEVYAIGLVVEFTNGDETDILHLPGRVSTSADLEPVDTGDQIDLEGCTHLNMNYKWRAYNTATVDQKPHEKWDPCLNRIWEYGTFGYWESSRVYPDDETVWGSLRCTPIRHHKMPDISVAPLFDGLNNNNPYEAHPMIYPIGLRIDHQSVYNAIRAGVEQGFITQEMADRISGYRLVRGNRVGNESIQSKGLLYDVWSYNKDNTQYFYPNYPFNDVRPDPFISFTEATYDRADSSVDPYKNTFTNTGRYTFHSPDAHFRNPAIGAEMKIEAIMYGQAEGFFNKVENHAKYKFLSTFAYFLSTAVGFAAALAQDKKVCMTHSKVGPRVEIGLTGGITSFPPYVTPIGGLLNGPPNSYSAISGEELLAHELTYQSCTGRMRDFLPAPHFLTPLFGSNPWRAGAIVGPNPTLDINPLFLPLEAFFILNGVIALPRLWYDIHNSLIEIDRFVTTLEFLVPNKNMAWQYQAVGKYNNYMLPTAGNVRRKILDYAYLRPNVLTIPEKTDQGNSLTIHFNNYKRESSLFLKIKDLLPTASTYREDDSRFLVTDKDMCKHPSNLVRSNVSSYYASLKTPRLDQYGSVFDIDYVETGHCSFRYYQDNDPDRVLDYSTVFGGDTFISEMALKRKHSFFIDTAFELPDNADFKYPEYANVGFPNFYFISKETIGERLESIHLSSWDLGDFLNPLKIFSLIQSLIGVPKNRLDCDPSQMQFLTGGLLYQKGMIYLHSYGIPYFICESTVNTDLRTARDTKAGDFYPRQGDIGWWLQEKNVSIKEDNQYHYNKDYSSQNTLIKNMALPPDYVPSFKEYPRDNMLIFAADQEGDNSAAGSDRWLQNLVADFYEFPMGDGKMISADGIENDKVLVRFEDTMKVYNSYVTINTSADTAIMSTGEIFKSKPQEFARTDTGHLGTQHKTILHTPFGHITVDAQRGNIFLLASGGAGVTDLAAQGNTDWFQENLPFQIKKDFPYIPDQFLDNPYRKLGIALGFDKRFKRLFVTKHDYKVLRKDIVWKDGEFYIARKKTILVTEVTSTCPQGYTLSADHSTCISNESGVTPALPTGVNIPFVGVERHLEDYSEFGTVVYDQYNVDGTPKTSTSYYQIPPSNGFWINNPRESITGPLNRVGIWSDSQIINNEYYPIQEWVGATIALTFEEDTLIYVGVAADNKIRIRIGCQLLVEQDPAAVSSALGIPGYLSGTFKWWHIYPVRVPKGTSYLEISAMNMEHQAVFGAEVYLNDFEEIQFATSYADLNVLWSTNELKGKTVDNFEYTCPGCEPLLKIDNNYYCVSDVPDVPPTTTTVTVEKEVVDLEWVCIEDKRYFCDRSWTAAFRLDYKFLIGFYSWHPNYYTGFDTFFQIGINTPCKRNYKSSVWSHLLTNKSFQVFFGKLYPWEIQPKSEPRPDYTILEYVSFKAEFWRYLNETDRVLKQNKTFSKAMVFTDRQCTGSMKLHLNGHDHSIRFPYLDNDGSAVNVRIDYHEGQHSLNYLYDQTHSQYNNVPFLISNCGNWRKDLNTNSINYLKQSRLTGRLRSEQFHVRLTNDLYSNYKILLHWCNFFTSQSQV
jgi:hypothetical protein